MKMYQFKEIIPQTPTAGQKAVEDVFAIAARAGVRTLRIYRILPHNFRFLGPLSAWAAQMACRMQYWLWSIVIARDSRVLVQHPIRSQHSFMRDPEGVAFLQRLRQCKRVKIVVLIHDVEELRGRGSTTGPDTIANMFELADVFIVHNHRMLDWFVQQGVAMDKLVSLELFDYLTDHVPNIDARSFVPVATFAGYLGTEGKKFLAQLKEIEGVEWRLYGKDYDEQQCSGGEVRYCGVAKAEELPRIMNQGFSLVWDGDSVDGSVGRWGEYFKFINPHKLSLSVVAGIPVVVCKGTYSAEFVERYGIGVAVDSLRELPALVKSMTLEQYMKMVNAAAEVSKRIRTGAFLVDALKKAMEV